MREFVISIDEELADQPIKITITLDKTSGGSHGSFGHVEQAVVNEKLSLFRDEDDLQGGSVSHVLRAKGPVPLPTESDPYVKLLLEPEKLKRDGLSLDMLREIYSFARQRDKFSYAQIYKAFPNIRKSKIKLALAYLRAARCIYKHGSTNFCSTMPPRVRKHVIDMARICYPLVMNNPGITTRSVGDAASLSYTSGQLTDALLLLCGLGLIHRMRDYSFPPGWQHFPISGAGNGLQTPLISEPFRSELIDQIVGNC